MAVVSTSLVVNPLASVEVLDDNGDLISGGPVPGRGMRYLTISATDRPRLHSLFLDLTQVGLGHLDVENDLGQEDIGILADHGILVGPDNVPERPLFACMLDDVGPAAVEENAAMTVNPTLEFEPFDMAKFRTWMQQKHLSPYHATAWVTDPLTEIRWGYWLSPDQAELVKGFEPGAKPSGAPDETLLGKLFAARILVNGSSTAFTSEAIRKDVVQAAAKFGADRYAIVDDVFPPAQLNALQDYYRRYVEQGFMKFGDDQVSGRFAEHGEHVAEMVHFAFTPLMRRIVGAEIRPTYAYSAVYTEGADLKPHVDREACEYSFSIQIDYSPEQADRISAWPLYLADNDPEDLRVDPGNDLAVRLANGSCLAYKGRELVHYRTPLYPGHRSTSLFFHYVPV
jgi:hypothetical protein